ncbi:MAG: efflux RND transporter periplasmic adaptor subunit [Planctomycetia bacterium]|nr:efflux RND transporter periplasmic adaptor subunit [Planctomycetia bacterium]
MRRITLFSVGLGGLAVAAVAIFFSISAMDSHIHAEGKTEVEAERTAAADSDAQLPIVLVENVVTRPEVTRKKHVGSFEPIQQVAIVSRITGNIEEQKFQEGNLVTADTVLFEMEKIRYEAALEAAKAGVASGEARIATIAARKVQCEAKITYAQSNYDRNETLYKQGGNLVTKDTVENIRSVLDALKAEMTSIAAEELAARAELDAAKAQLKLAGDDMEHTTIRAMITGRAGRVHYTVGNYVTPNSGPLVTIVQLDPIYLRFSMSEKDFTTMFGNVDNLRAQAKIRIELAGGTFYEEQGEISFIDNKMTSETNTINIWATFRNSHEFLNPGGVATVYLEKEEDRQFPAVKESAILFDGHAHSVYIVGPDNLVEKRTVVPGTSDGVYQTIVSGLNGDEVVITDGTHKIRFIPGPDGKPMPVKVRTTYTPTPAAVGEGGSSAGENAPKTVNPPVAGEETAVDNGADKTGPLSLTPVDNTEDAADAVKGGQE